VAATVASPWCGTAQPERSATVIEALLQTLLNGAASGGVYALVALGYTLVFSVLGVINFAQGALFSLGGYLSYLLMGGRIGVNGALPGWGLPAGLPFWLALLLAAAGLRVWSLCWWSGWPLPRCAAAAPNPCWL
jgi:branched-subunit amino acid ABC-type transport system permease component